MPVDTRELKQRFDSLRQARGTLDSHLQEVAERVLPRHADFQDRLRVEGQKRTEKQYDATAALALERFAAAMEMLLTPRASKWHDLRAGVPEIDEDDDVRRYLERVRDLLFKVRYTPRANFASQQHEVYMQLGAFGTGILFVDEMPTGGVRYQSIPMSSIFMAENEYGVVDTVYRKTSMELRQVLMMFGPKNVSDNLSRRADKAPYDKVEIVHAVMPRKERDPTSLTAANKPFASVWFEYEEGHKLRESGYDECPYIVSRYVTGTNETYGRSPAMTILPDIKMLNEMSRTVIRAGQKSVDPPMLIADDGVIMPINLTAGGFTFARMEGRSQPPVMPIQTGARVDIGFEMMEQRRRTINDAFLINLFQILVDSPQMTATEVMERAQEKGALLAPTAGRQQSEALGPMIEREINILARQGILPPPPRLLQEIGGEITIEYSSPMARAQRAEEGVGIFRTLEGVQTLAAFDPAVLDNFDNDTITRTLADINGMPRALLRRAQDVAGMRQQRAEDQAAQQAAQNLPLVADAALKTSQIAQQAAG
jgi:hypothetical protein